MLKIKTRYRTYNGNTYTLNHWWIWLYKMGLIETHVVLLEDVLWWDWLHTMGLHETDYIASLDLSK